MKNRLIILDNFFAKSGANIETDDVCASLYSHFGGVWPSTAKIYHNELSDDTLIELKTKDDIDAFQAMTGTFYVIVYPANPVQLVVAVIVIAVVSVATAMLLAPKAVSPSSMPITTMRNRQQSSANNELSDRVNTPRPGARIPDIYGRVRATPDLLAVPFTVYSNNREIEYAYMCIGRGWYEIENVYDDNTLLEEIEGAAADIYGPDTSPNSGSPDSSINGGVDEDLWNSKRVNAVNGQILPAPNKTWIRSTSILRYEYPNIVRLINNDTISSFFDYFSNGQNVSISMGNFTAGVTVNLTGNYTIATINSSTELTLSSPASVNSDWTLLASTTNDRTEYSHPNKFMSNNATWIGPFIIDNGDIEKLYCNFSAVNGLYKDSGTQVTASTVGLAVGITPVDENGDPTDSEQVVTFNFVGTNDASRPPQNMTQKITLSNTGRSSIRARRTTNIDLDFNGTVIDETRWKDAYAMTAVPYDHFGNVTTIYVKTQATTGALAVKNRKLNAYVTRVLPVVPGEDDFDDLFAPTTSMAPIISAICLDPYIGRRTMDEVDFEQIYAVQDEIAEYFGIGLATTFNYTFDKIDISFEETIAMIADAVFCTAYRQGQKIRLYFERETNDSILLFNHRNKIPGSETRTIKFGRQNDYDGIEYTYASRVDGSLITYNIPEDGSAVNPQRIESIGIVNKLQAVFHAWRIWNRLQYQNTAIEFESTREADILVNTNRILVSDGTRPVMFEGEITRQFDGTILTLSQPFTFDPEQTYTAFIQNITGNVESINIVSYDEDTQQIELSTTPSEQLSTDADNFARATYIIVGSDTTRSNAFLLASKEPSDRMVVKVSAINYDSRYYAQDYDYIDEIRNEYGNYTGDGDEEIIPAFLP